MKGVWETSVRVLLALLAGALLGGCATLPLRGEVADDAFQTAQEASGLQEPSRHPEGAALYREQARHLWEELARAPVTPRSFGPRLVLSRLLREALASGERVEYADLLRRLERFESLVVLRPDGCLVTALTGEPIQRLGRVRLEDGELKVGRLTVGCFYFSRGGVLYPVDEALRRANTPPWAELGLERDWLNAAMDGAQDAVGELTVALAQSVLHPIRSIQDLRQLPFTLALLIASSPEYFARFGALPLQEQIREAARLSTHLLMMYGGAGPVASMGRVGSLGAGLPVLSLTAEGLLQWRAAAVTAGAVATVEVGGAIAIAHLATASWPPTGGPGQWVVDTSNMSDDARTYQAQVTGAPKGWAYRVCRNGECVDYDGYDDKADRLLEAKGTGYDQWFTVDLNAKFTFNGLKSLESQARRQSAMAGRMHIRWYVAEPRMVAILQKIFKRLNITNIEVVYEQPS